MIHTLITHDDPHFEEILGRWELRRFGREKFPGVESAKLLFWKGGKAPDGKPAEVYEKEGCLLIGVGGGRFDEHLPGGDRKSGETTASLIAKELGIYELPELVQLLRFAQNVDSKAVAHPFDLSSLVKAMHRLHPDAPRMVVDWATEAIEAKYEEQRRFWSAKADLDRALRTEVRLLDGRIVTMAVVDSDNPEFQNFTRSEHGGRIAIVVQRRQTGNVQIFTEKKACLELADVHAALVCEEMKLGG